MRLIRDYKFHGDQSRHFGREDKSCEENSLLPQVIMKSVLLFGTPYASSFVQPKNPSEPVVLLRARMERVCQYAN
jgi:hypothetical protein